MEWISIEEDLPVPRDIVLCCDIYNTFISLGRYIESDDCFELMNIEGIEIDTNTTHWMPLPEPPRSENEEFPRISFRDICDKCSNLKIACVCMNDGKD